MTLVGSTDNLLLAVCSSCVLERLSPSLALLSLTAPALWDFLPFLLLCRLFSPSCSDFSDRVAGTSWRL